MLWASLCQHSDLHIVHIEACHQVSTHMHLYIVKIVVFDFSYYSVS